MKQKLTLLLSIAAAACVCILFGTILTFYTKPMEDISYDLSVLLEDGAEPSLEDYDDKGWSVFTQNGDNKTMLEPDGGGGYLNLNAGETFYFSRVLKETLDSPSIKLTPYDRTFSIWLDDELIYTDYPEMDNRIGYLTLPMNGWDRTDPIIISLPKDYQGKTLTIAQSTYASDYEVFTARAFPAAVTLYCGYAYESSLISESFLTAIWASGAFFIGLLLLAAFIFNRNIGLLFLSFMPFLWMTIHLTEPSFYMEYIDHTTNSVSASYIYISIGAFLIFLATKAGKYSWILWGGIGVYLVSLTAYVMELNGKPFSNVYTHDMSFYVCWIGLFLLLYILTASILVWHKDNWFHQTFRILAPVSIIGLWSILLITNKEETMDQVALSLGSGSATYVFHRIFLPLAAAAIVTAVLDVLKTELDRRTEQKLLTEHYALTAASYENLKSQHEEVMMIRHDMLKHFHAIKDMSADPSVNAYLEELIGQNQKVRTVIQTGNEMLDIILNGMFHEAAKKGIQIEVSKSCVPSSLPLSDADLCSLMMNIMDNAMAGASFSGLENPYIRIDVHEKNNFLAIVCENASSRSKAKKKHIKETVPKHGLGLKIIHQIVKKYHGVANVEQNEERYKIQIAIPLS